MRIYLLLVLSFLSLVAQAGDPEKTDESKRDTVQAVVLYGEEILFDAVVGLTDEQVSDLRDSVMKYHGANQLTNYISLYLSLKNKSEEELNHYIDSLFESEGEIPYALINQINIFLANKPETIEFIRAQRFVYWLKRRSDSSH